MLTIESFGTTTGKIVSNKTYQSIVSLPTHEILEQFKLSGLLLFRGFGVTYEEMGVFSRKFSSEYVHAPVREIVGSDNFIQLVDKEMYEVPPHCENSFTPFRPDVVWFCCKVPATEDGETLFWDGVKVWELLSEPVKELFLSKKIKYKINLPVNDPWRSFFGKETTIPEVISNLENVTYHIKEDESVDYEYTCSAVVNTKFGNQKAFTNSIVIVHTKPDISVEKINYNLEDFNEKVYFEDGSRIPDVVLDEIKEVINRLTNKISWYAGDLAMIDNSKFLHGRRAFRDQQRQIYTQLSYLKPEI